VIGLIGSALFGTEGGRAILGLATFAGAIFALFYFGIVQL
jgi:hypothetical protein